MHWHMWVVHTIAPATNAAQSAIGFGFLRQVPTLIVTAATTSIGSVISSGTATAARALSCRL
jgi:hypothetical protein